MAQMRDEIARVQADRDKFEQRVNQLELRAAEGKDKPASASPPPAAADAIETPKLKIVHLTPQDGAPAPSEGTALPEADDVEDGAPRPTIRISGAPSRPGRVGLRTPDQIEQTLPEDSGRPAPRTARPSALDPDAKRAYDAALALVNTKQYARGLDAFAAFLVRWPDHPYADNATYWRGECYFAQGEYARAAEQFEGGLLRFPMGNKAPDALLKLGISNQKLGRPEKAKEAFERLRRDFPRSDAARRIPNIQEPK